MNQECIGKFIAECRKKKGLTQNELAIRLGVTDKAISKWENGRCLPDLALIKPLCKELDISMNELINGDYIEKSDLEEKSESTLDNTIAYIDKKEKKEKKKLFLILGVVSILFLVFGIFAVKRYIHQNYYALENANIMYEEYLNTIEKNMDEISEKDANGNWMKFKTSSGNKEYDQARNELVGIINESYKYLVENKDVNIARNYQIKGRVSKKELEYLNSIKDNLTCLNFFSKYRNWWSTEDEAEKNIYEKVSIIYSVQNTPLYKKEKLTFAELNSKLLFEAKVIELLSYNLYGEYHRENIE